HACTTRTCVQACQSDNRTFLLQRHGSFAMCLCLYRFFAYLLSGGDVACSPSEPDPPCSWRSLYVVDAVVSRAGCAGLGSSRLMAPFAGHGRLLSTAPHDCAGLNSSYRRSSPQGEHRRTCSHCLLRDTDVRHYCLLGGHRLLMT